MNFTKLFLLVTVGISQVCAQYVPPPIEASVAQMAAGTAGAPYYVSPRRLAGGGGPGIFSSVTDTGLTAGRVVFVSTGGLLADEAAFAYNSSTNTMTVDGIVGNTATAVTITGGSTGATLAVGKGSDGRIVLTPGSTVSSGLEYVDILASTLAGTITGDSFGLRTLFTQNGTTVGYHCAGILGQTQIPASSSTAINAWHAGLYGYLKHSGSGAVAEGEGVYGVITINGPGNILEGNAFRSQLEQQASTGRFIIARHFYAPPLSNASATTIPTLLVAFDAADQGVDGELATTVYAFRSAGNTPSLFGPTTVSSLATGSTIRSSGTSAATALDTGMIRSLGGASISKNLWLGTQLVFEATASSNTIGINFGSGEYIYRKGANTIRIDGANVEIGEDLYPATNGTKDLGTTAARWRHIWASGTATLGAATIGIMTVGAGGIVDKILTATAALDFGSILAAASADLTITVTGALVGDNVLPGLPADPDASLVFDWFVSASNTVTVRAHNVGSIAVDQASKTFRATIVSFQ